MSPSTLAVSMSAPLPSSCFTSSLSPAAQAAKNTQPSLNPIRLFLDLGSPGSRKVSLSCQRFSCSALLIRAELERVSRDMATINSKPSSPSSPLSASQCTVLLGAGQSCRLALRLLANSCYFLRRAASEPRLGRQQVGAGGGALRQLAGLGGVHRQGEGVRRRRRQQDTPLATVRATWRLASPPPTSPPSNLGRRPLPRRQLLLCLHLQLAESSITWCFQILLRKKHSEYHFHLRSLSKSLLPVEWLMFFIFFDRTLVDELIHFRAFTSFTNGQTSPLTKFVYMHHSLLVACGSAFDNYGNQPSWIISYVPS